MAAAWPYGIKRCSGSLRKRTFPVGTRSRRVFEHAILRRRVATLFGQFLKPHAFSGGIAAIAGAAFAAAAGASALRNIAGGLRIKKASPLWRTGQSYHHCHDREDHAPTVTSRRRKTALFLLHLDLFSDADGVLGVGFGYRAVVDGLVLQRANLFAEMEDMRVG